MKSYEFTQLGRVIVIHLRKGEKLLESITSELERLGVKHAILTSCIGSLRKMTIHIIKSTADLPENEFITVEGAIEFGVAQGVVINGAPHIHVVTSVPGQKTYVGHLENGCEVQYLAEISLLEVKDMDLTRIKDEFGIYEIVPKK